MAYRLRGLIFTAMVAGAFIATSAPLMALALTTAVLTAYALGVRAAVRIFLLTAALPLAAMLLLVWGVLVAAPPGLPVGSDRIAGVEYASIMALRIALLGVTIQAVFLSIPAERLPALLASWGIRGDAGLVVAGTIALLPEMRRRVEQVATARIARGALGRRSWLRQLAQVPHLIRPLMVLSLTAAVSRAEAWAQRGTLAKVATLDQRQPNTHAGEAIGSIAAIGFLAAAILSRWLQ